MATVATVATLWSTAARATITQGDFSVFGFFETREEGRWGEGGSANNGTPTTFTHPTPTTTVANQGIASSYTGGSFDFNHWDLDEARQLGDIRPDYHMVKNYKFLGRFDTLVLKDADFFAFYRPWYDAEGTLKNKGRAIRIRDAFNYNHQTLQQEYFRDDLHEYYGQLNFTDNFSARIGKQEVIWSEADALSGTEITNSVDSTYHGFIPFESAEDLRKNVRMVKFNYILPDFMKTANNELETFWIPGDYQGNGVVANVNDARSPWAVASGRGSCRSQRGRRRVWRAMASTRTGSRSRSAASCSRPFKPIDQPGRLLRVRERSPDQPESIELDLENSEFGARLSSLLPVGNGLQASFIYLYENRNDATGICTSCAGHGTPLFVGQYFYGGQFGSSDSTPRPAGWCSRGWYPGHPSGQPVPSQQLLRFTGTYYDKEFTDIVYRYDTLYTNNQGINVGSTAEWASQGRFIVAGDRPTYIPWISKQHTFLTAQYVNTWYPNRPTDSVPSIANTLGKVREDSNFFFVSAVNWVLNGQLTTTNAWVWDVDDNVGDVQSTNVYRYSRNVLFGVNAVWFLGRSGRYSDPFLASVEQRTNELEFTLTYEI